MEKTVMIEGMMCENCRKHVKKALESIGNVNVKVDLKEKKAYIDSKKDVSDETIVKSVEEAGYKVTKIIQGDNDEG